MSGLPMQRLQIELPDRFDGDRLHGGTQHGFSNRFRVAEVVLLLSLPQTQST
jgi:hypothetical protein